MQKLARSRDGPKGGFRQHKQQGSLMNVINFAAVAPPKYSAKDFHYEDDLRAVLGPLLTGLLDRAEAGGWDRQRAAYAAMILAADEVRGKDVRRTGTTRVSAAPSLAPNGASH
jgi:hypothetical protein